MIEVSIALIIVGLIMVPMLQIYKNTLMRQKILDTTDNILIVQAALSKYVDRNGFYPAPADQNLPVNALGSGAAVDPVASPPAACNLNSVTVCSTNTGGIDADGNGTPDTVYIGAVPYAALGIPYQATIDGYGYQLKYAVTANMTSEPTFNNNQGAIRILNDGRDPARPQLYDATMPQAHYAVISHGEDARGAFNQSGLVTVACGTIANGLDFENCNNDTVFRNHIFQHEDFPDTTPGDDGDPNDLIQFNRVAGPLFFDDFVIATNTTTSGVWAYVPNESQINTTQDGNVELGTDPACTNASCRPRARMNVNGSVIAEDELRVSRLCATNDADCRNDNAATLPYQWFTPQVLMGTPDPTTTVGEGLGSWDAARQGNRGAGIRCTDDRGLGGISNFDEVCRNTVRISNPSIVGPGCNPSVDGLFPIGISATGQIICGNPLP